MVMVIVIFGIISVYALPKTSFDSSPLTFGGQADLLSADLKRLQWMATTRNSSICVSVTSGSYSAHPYTTSCDTGTAITDPVTNTAFVVTLPATITLTDSAPGTPLYFNGLGAPSRQGTYQLTATSGGLSRTISVTPVTGYITNTAP